MRVNTQAKNYAEKVEKKSYDGVDSRRIFKNKSSNSYKKYGELRAYERWQLRLMLQKAFLAGRKSVKSKKITKVKK